MQHYTIKNVLIMFKRSKQNIHLFQIIYLNNFFYLIIFLSLLQIPKNTQQQQVFNKNFII